MNYPKQKSDSLFSRDTHHFMFEATERLWNLEELGRKEGVGGGGSGGGGCVGGGGCKGGGGNLIDETRQDQ